MAWTSRPRCRRPLFYIICTYLYVYYHICNLRETSVAGVDQSPEALTPIEPRSPRSRTISRDCSSMAPLRRTLTCNIIYLHTYVYVCACVHIHTFNIIYTYIYIHTYYTFIYAYIYIHTNIHIHMYMYS